MPTVRTLMSLPVSLGAKSHTINNTCCVAYGRRPLKRAMLLVVIGVSILIMGCGGAGEKGKNKDKDIPKAPATK